MLTFHFSGADGAMVEAEALTSGMVGKQVKLEFSSEWDGLVKTVVFSAGAVSRDVVYTGEIMTIPAEVLKEAKRSPQKYPNLQVRLCGWNVLFSSLSEQAQNEFIMRAGNAQ